MASRSSCATSSAWVSPPHLCDKPANFFTPALFVTELDNLVRHPRTERDFDLLGQSWGVTLATEHDEPPRARGNDRRAGVPGGARVVLRGAHTHPRGVTPGGGQVTDADGRGFDGIQRNCSSWAHSCAPLHRLAINEFIMTDILKDWTVIPNLAKSPARRWSSMAPLFYGIKKVKWVTLGSSSRTGFWEEPEKYFGILGNFLADSNPGNGAEAQEV
ncbi:hypothetical protein H4582DRAFT_2057027 [Lactarius indigo]|nr:hypothetical protein H4582DRAFT_2057027 [Lactarius indigo]